MIVCGVEMIDVRLHVTHKKPHLSVCHLEELQGGLLELISHCLDGLRSLCVLLCQYVTDLLDLLLQLASLKEKRHHNIIHHHPHPLLCQLLGKLNTKK